MDQALVFHTFRANKMMQDRKWKRKSNWIKRILKNKYQQKIL